MMHEKIACIGGGNMASAILGGLRKQGLAAEQCIVIEPFDAARTKLQHNFGISALAHADASLNQAQVVLWAIKPQHFKQAAQATIHHCNPQALHISIAAGITTTTLSNWLNSNCIIRCMPNTPALIGQGMSGLYALPQVSTAQRNMANTLLAPTGQLMWLEEEHLIDSLTAVSGSGPAYVFYWIEALIQGGVELGLTAQQAQQLATQTVAGAAALVQASDENPSTLRQQVTSKGGTTHEAIESMRQNAVPHHIVQAMQACYQRAQAMAQEFGNTDEPAP